MRAPLRMLCCVCAQFHHIVMMKPMSIRPKPMSRFHSSLMMGMTAKTHRIPAKRNRKPNLQNKPALTLL